MKRRILEIAIVLLALWPAVHFGLTQAYGVNPWKLFGWAMYAAPGPAGNVRVVGILPNGRRVELERSLYTPEEQQLIDRHFNYWTELGDLASWAPVAEKVLALHPEFESVMIATLRYRIGRWSARVEADARRTRFYRDGRSEPFGS